MFRVLSSRRATACPRRIRGSAGKWPAAAQSVPSWRLVSPCAVRQGELWLSGACAEAAREPDALDAMMPRSYAPEVRGASTDACDRVSGSAPVVGQEMSDDNGADDRRRPTGRLPI